MGSNALTVATPGQDIPASHHNELVQALLQNHVPRNAARTAQDLAGQLGESALRWLRAYVQTYHIGTASANLTIEEVAPGEIHILRDVNKEKLILKNGSLELWINNNLTVSFSANSWGGVEQYIGEDYLKPKQKFIYGTFNAPVRGDFGATPFTAVINNCKAGKKLWIEIGGIWADQNGAIMELILYVNGAAVINTSGVQYNGVRFLYPIPSNGNYTITMDYRDGGIRNPFFVDSNAPTFTENDDGYYRIEEV